MLLMLLCLFKIFCIGTCNDVLFNDVGPYYSNNHEIIRALPDGIDLSGCEDIEISFRIKIRTTPTVWHFPFWIGYFNNQNDKQMYATFLVWKQTGAGKMRIDSGTINVQSIVNVNVVVNNYYDIKLQLRESDNSYAFYVNDNLKYYNNQQFTPPNRDSLKTIRIGQSEKDGRPLTDTGNHEITNIVISCIETPKPLEYQHKYLHKYHH